jgi:hypothetical protein
MGTHPHGAEAVPRNALGVSRRAPSRREIDLGLYRLSWDVPRANPANDRFGIGHGGQDRVVPWSATSTGIGTMHDVRGGSRSQLVLQRAGQRSIAIRLGLRAEKACNQTRRLAKNVHVGQKCCEASDEPTPQHRIERIPISSNDVSPEVGVLPAKALGHRQN